MTELERKLIHESGNDKQTIALLLSILDQWAQGKNPLTITQELLNTTQAKNYLKG